MKKSKADQQILLSFISIFILLVFAGCSIISLDKKEPGKTFFVFNEISDNKEATKSKPLPVSLVLMEFTAAPDFKTNQFIYKRGNQYIKDYYNRFFSPPEKMIQTKCAKWFINTGLLKNVSTKSQASSSDFILKGELLEIYCDRTKNTTSYAIIKIQFSIIRYSEPEKTIMEKDLYSKVEFKHFSAEDLVDAWTKCLHNIFQTLNSEISSNV